MNRNPSSPERDPSSSIQRYRSDSSLLQRGLAHLANLQELPSASELAIGSPEPPLLWSFAAYSNDLQDVVAKRPSASVIIIENIPDELKERQQWICWEWEYRGRGQYLGECPISPITGGGAWTTPDRWGSFVEALAFSEFHGLAGIGFVLTKDDPYICVDLYERRYSATQLITPRAEEIIAGINSYTEITPSGRSLLIIARGRLPGYYDPDTYHPAFEEHPDHFDSGTSLWPDLIDRDWFLPITGQYLPNAPNAITDREAELRQLDVDWQRVSSGPGRTRNPDALIKRCRYADQMVVLTTNAGNDVCIDVRTGNRVHDADIPPAPPPQSSDIYTANGTCIECYSYVDLGPCVVATDSVTEEELWCFPHDGDPLSCPVDIDPKSCSVAAESGIVYINVDEDLFALDERSGEILWKLEEDSAALPEVADGIAYVHLADGICGLDGRTGKEIWRLTTDGPITGSILADSRIYIGEGGSNINGVDAIAGSIDEGSSICCVDAFTGTVQWKLRSFEGGHPFAVLDRVVAVCGPTLLGALDAKTGEILWERKNNQSWSYLDWRLGALGPATVMDGETIYIGDDNGGVVALESTTGRERWRLEIGDAVRLLRVVNDIVLVAGQHVLYALQHV